MGINIIIIGTGHVLEKSIRDVKRVIEEKNPGIIAVELDHNRFEALEQEHNANTAPDDELSFKKVLKKTLGGGSFPVLLEGCLALIQKEIGAQLGKKPGADMHAAIECAKEKGCKIALIDRDIEITLNHILAIPLKEKLRLFRQNDKDMEVLMANLGGNIENVLHDENIEIIIDNIKTKLPSLHMALIDERDRHMATAILGLTKRFPGEDIVVVVGAGHKKGISDYLKNPEKINIKNINKMRRISRLQIFVLSIPILILYIFIKIKCKIRK